MPGGASTRVPIRNVLHQYDRQRGFTLIELLVVISVVMLLTAILLPALGAARRTARMTVCASNLHQLGIASVNYTSDAHGYLPYGSIQGPSPESWVRSWDDLLNPYHHDNLDQSEIDDVAVTRDLPVIRCPEDDIERDASILLSDFPISAGPTPTPRSYTLPSAEASFRDGPYTFMGIGHSDIVLLSMGGGSPWSRRIGDISRPSEQIFLAERFSTINIAGSMSHAGIDLPIEQITWWRDDVSLFPPQPITDPNRSAHGQAWNYVFTDGHVEALPIEDTVRPAATSYLTLVGFNHLWSVRTDD